MDSQDDIKMEIAISNAVMIMIVILGNAIAIGIASFGVYRNVSIDFEREREQRKKLETEVRELEHQLAVEKWRSQNLERELDKAKLGIQRLEYALRECQKEHDIKEIAKSITVEGGKVWVKGDMVGGDETVSGDKTSTGET